MSEFTPRRALTRVPLATRRSKRASVSGTTPTAARPVAAVAAAGGRLRGEKFPAEGAR